MQTNRTTAAPVPSQPGRNLIKLLWKQLVLTEAGSTGNRLPELRKPRAIVLDHDGLALNRFAAAPSIGGPDAVQAEPGLKITKTTPCKE
jgi:hypothetical protein